MDETQAQETLDKLQRRLSRLDSMISILVDEEGIWRDEPTDQLSHYSLRTFHTDSGIGPGTGKSSSATLNQFRSEYGSEEDYVPQGQIPTPVREESTAKENSSQIDSKSTTSYHISELEHSESQQENISFEHHSYDSDQALEFPELNDESYLFSDQSNARAKSASHGNSDEKSVDFDKYVQSSNYADVFHDLGQGHDYEGQVEGQMPPQPYEQTAEEIAQAVMADDDLDQSLHSSEGEEVSDIEGENYDKFQPNVDLSRYNEPGVLPHVSKFTSKRTKKRHSSSDQENDGDGKRPPIVGDSIFTQEEFSNNRQSLAEFEQLEAALEHSVSENEAADNQLDLIGAYLKGLKESEEDDAAIDEEIAYHSENDSRIRQSRDPSRLHAHARHHKPHSPASPRVYDTDKNGYRHQQDSISMISGSVDEIMLEPNLQDDSIATEPREGEPDELGALPTLADTMRSFGDSLPFERSFDATTLYAEYNYSDENLASLQHYDHDEHSLPRAQTPSRIPILRSGSPSRSRPGSRGPNSRPTSRSASRGPGSRPTSRSGYSPSPDRKPLGPNQTGIPGPTANNNKGPRRALPLTPQKRRQGVSPSSPGPQNDAPPSARSETTSHTTAVSNQMSQTESELGRATKLLLMDDDELNRRVSSSKHAYDMIGEEQDIVPSLASHSPHPKSNTPKSGRERSPAKESSPELRTSADESGGEDLSQGSTASKRELKTRYIEEVNSRKQNEETLNQLQKEYQNLLKKYAEAENVIDDLRLGAKVKLYVEGPPAGTAVPGTMSQGAKTHGPMHPMQGVQGRMTPTQMAHQAIVGSLQQSGIRPPSRASHSSSAGGEHSQASQNAANPTPHGVPNGNVVPGVQNAVQTAMSNDDLESLQGDGVKLSLLVKAKAIEEQTNAFEILLSEKQLTLEDQSKALENIKSNYENLTQDYRNAKDEHDYRRRQGLVSEGANEPGFDETKEVEGELYKINMKLDELEHSVQENLKQKSARKPFSGKAGPMKADHSIVTDTAKRTKPTNDVTGRQPSFGSLVGGAAVDKKLHSLHKEYSDLMDLYRRVKGLKKSPERDAQLDSLLNKLKEVYERTPEHRRPALPPELEQQYSSTTGSFLPSDKITRTADNDARAARAEQSTHRRSLDSAIASERDSDYAERGPRTTGRPPPSPVPRTSNSYPYSRTERLNTANPRRDRLNSDSTAVSDVTGSRAGRGVYGTESESDAQGRTRYDRDSDGPRQGRSRYDRETARRLPRPGPGPRSRGRDSPGADKGYSWSGATGRSTGGTSTGSRNLPQKPGTRTSAMMSHTSPRSRSRSEDELSDTLSSSGSADSVIYNGRRRSGSREKQDELRNSLDRLRGETSGSRERDPLSGARGQNLRPGQDLRTRSRSRGRARHHSMSDDYSEDKTSPRSEKLRSLTDEVERLKERLNPGTAHNLATENGTYSQFAQNVQAPPTSQIVPPLALNQPSQAVSTYANQAVNHSQVPPIYANQPVNQAQMPPGYAVSQPQVPPMYANQTVNQAQVPMYANQPYPAQYNGYEDPYAPGEDYYDDYPYDEADYENYDDGFEPRHNRYRSNSLDDRKRQPYGSGSRDRYGSGSRDRYRAGSLRGEIYDSGEDYDAGRRSRYSRLRGGDPRNRGDRLGSAERYGSRSRDGSGNRYGSTRNRSHSRGRSRDRSGYYSDPDSPTRSPARVSEMRRYFVPRRGSPVRRNISPIRTPNTAVSPVRQNPYAAASPANYAQTFTQPPQPYYGAHAPAQAAVQNPPIGMAPQTGIPVLNGPQIGVTPPMVQNLPQSAAYVPSQNGTIYGGSFANPAYQAQNAGLNPQFIPSAGVANGYQNGVANGYQNGGSYQATQTANCPMCGGMNQHCHSEYHFAPAGVATAQTQNSQSGLVPVKIMPASQAQRGPKVRYYVREYGGESASEAEARVYRKSSRVKTYVLDDGTEEEYGGRGIDDSLHEALRTASKLKNMSSRMRDSLNDEINRSIKEGSFLFAH